MLKISGAFNHNAGVACLMMLRLALLKPLPEVHAPASYSVPRFQIHRREWHVRGGRTICLGGRRSWLFVFSILHSLNGCYILNIERWLCVRHVALRTRKYRWAGARVKERNLKGSHGLRSMSSSIGASSVFQWLWVLLCLALDWLCFIFTE